MVACEEGRRRREERDTRKVSLGWRDESRRLVEIYARASSRSKRISLISLSAGGGCDDVLLFFRDRSNEQRGGGEVTLMSDGTSLFRERNPR